jgi:hypothetical protein
MMMKVKVPQTSDATCVLLDVYHTHGLKKQKVSPEFREVEIDLPDGAELLGICCQYVKSGNKPDLQNRQVYNATEGRWTAYREDIVEQFKSFDNTPKGGDPKSPVLKNESDPICEDSDEVTHFDVHCGPQILLQEENLVEEELELNGEASVEVE